jgi:hypothetical protein
MKPDIQTGAKGKSIDMNLLRKQNEKIRAISNVKLNARGDTIDSNNTVVQSINQRVQQQYDAQVQPKKVETPPIPPVAPPIIFEQPNTFQPLTLEKDLTDDEF